MGRTGTAGTMVDELGATLREEILSGKLAPGSRLREVELAAQFDVSRNTLREAFRELIASGLLSHRPNRGVSVVDPSPGELREVYRVRRLLELPGLDLLGADGIERLARSAEAIEAAAEAEVWEGLVEADIAFHSELVRALGSPRLDRFFGRLLSSLRLAFISVDRTHARAAPPGHVAEHRLIVDARREGRIGDAQRLLEGHLELAEALLLDRLEGVGG